MNDLDTETAREVNAQTDLNQALGSLIERWTTRSTSGCRFCNAPLEGDPQPSEAFCDEECEDSFSTVMEARIVLGQRDMAQRGYD